MSCLIQLHVPHRPNSERLCLLTAGTSFHQRIRRANLSAPKDKNPHIAVWRLYEDRRRLGALVPQKLVRSTSVSILHLQIKESSLKYRQQVCSHGSGGNQLLAWLTPLPHPPKRKLNTLVTVWIDKLQYQQLHIITRTKSPLDKQVIRWLSPKTTMEVWGAAWWSCITVLSYSICPYIVLFVSMRLILVTSTGQVKMIRQVHLLPFSLQSITSLTALLPLFTNYPSRQMPVQLGRISAYYQQMVKKKSESDKGLTAQMTHGIHSEAMEMNTGVVSRR